MKTLTLALALCVSGTAVAQERRPFGTLGEQAALQQSWLEKRLKTILPGLMRKHGIDMWVIPDARIHGRPDVHVAGFADDIRREAPHDLRVLRQMRRQRWH
jgi:hypothetical protein